MSSNFETELARWGPSTSGTETLDCAIGSLDEAFEYCRRLARSHYENFPLVSWMLPKPLHQHFFNIYAYCRWSDDLADEVHDTSRSLELLSWWRSELQGCYEGRAVHPVFMALHLTIQEFEIPLEPFEDLISAFEQDQRTFEYATFEDLLDYCRRSANPVGRLVLYLCRQFNSRNVEWSDSVCTGLQLANFWQDVRRDAEIGRVYLPKEDRERYGYSDEDLKNCVTNDAFIGLMKFQVDRARRYLQQVFPLADQLPGRLKIDIELFGRGGLKILDRIEKIEYGVWEHRPVVTKYDAMSMLIAAISRTILAKCGLGGRHTQSAEIAGISTR